MIKLCLSGDPFPTLGFKVFLAGPTPRTTQVASWRPEAIQLFRDQGFEGTLIIPEPFVNIYDSYEANYHTQIKWEDDGLTKADCILFWVPRELKTMPGFTTNVEFGSWINSGKVVYGRPKGADKIGYLDYHAKKHGVKINYDLAATVQEACGKILK